MNDQKQLINLLRHELHSKLNDNKFSQEEFNANMVIIDTLNACLTQDKKSGIQDLINDLNSDYKESIYAYLSNSDKVYQKTEEPFPMKPQKNSSSNIMDSKNEMFNINLITESLNKLNKEINVIKTNAENSVKEICDKLINVITFDLIHPLKESYNTITETIQHNLKKSEDFTNDLAIKIDAKLNKLESTKIQNKSLNKASNLIIIIIAILLTSFFSAFIATKYLSSVNNSEFEKSKKFDLIINRINNLPSKEKSYVMEQLGIK